MFDDTPNRLEAPFVQRNDNNEHYEQINISGSNLIVYLNEYGKIDADKINVWAEKYNIGSASYVINTTSASWASSSLTSSYILFDGNRPITRNDPDFFGLNVGGEHVTDFLENFFFPFNVATVDITTPSSTIYYETGSVQTPTVEATVTAYSETTFYTGSIRRDGEAWNTIVTVPPLVNSYLDTNISSSHSYRTFIQTDNEGNPSIISSSTRNISFIYPYLYGVSSTPGLIDDDLYTTLQSKSISTESDFLDYFWGVGSYIYFAYPSTYGPLTSILDPNNFELLPSFEYSSSVPVTSSGLTYNWTNNYKVYRLKLMADPNGKFQFLS